LTLYTQNKPDGRHLFNSRNARVSQVCHDLQLNQTVDYAWHFYILKSASVAWCPVYKAAATNWMHNLVYLAGYDEEGLEKIAAEMPLYAANMHGRHVAPELSLHSTQQYLQDPSKRKMIIVRDPFGRLVSAFRDKLERCMYSNCDLEAQDFAHQEQYYHRYGKEIVSKTRGAAIRRFGEAHFSRKNNYGVNGSSIHRVGELPIFWEFVQWFLIYKKELTDEHWAPMHWFCNPCAVNYQYILKFENLEPEEEMLRVAWNTTKIKNLWENRNDNGRDKDDITVQYFSMLDHEDILKLYEIYKIDFEMFGYDASPYLNLHKKSRPKKKESYFA